MIRQLNRRIIHFLLAAFLISGSCSLISVCKAGIGKDLMAFFKSAGIASNVTSPGSYQDQTAGFYSGGSIIARNGVRNAQLATVQMPGYRAGCGGIHAWGGAFSYIKAGELVELARNIGSATAAYAFMLAVQTVSPQIYNIMNELQNLATQINQANINSCEMGATLLGGVWPKSDQASKHLCQNMGTNLGMFSDYASSRHDCGAGGDRGRVIKGGSSDPRYKDMFVGDFNLAWKAIQANAFLRQDKELAELFLTLVGSIIVRSGEPQTSHFKGGAVADKSHQVINLIGYADKDDVINGLLIGGKTLLYVCNDEACLEPKLTSITLSEPHSLRGQVHGILESIVQKIYEDGEPKPEEKDFFNATRLPIFKMLNVLTAFRKGQAPLDIHQYEDLIAIDILYKYVMEVIDIVHDSVVQLRSVQVNDSHIEQFLHNLHVARKRITALRNSTFQYMDSMLSFVEATQTIEKQLHIMMGGMAADSNFY